MTNTAELLAAFESCSRKAHWLLKWAKHRLTPSDALRYAVLAGLTETENQDYGELAGSEFMTLAHERGLDVIDSINLYRSACNHAAIADIVTTAARKSSDPPWMVLESTPEWAPSCFIDSTGTYLRRFLPVSSWNDERAAHEARSWFSIGEQSYFKMPMQLVVAVIGQMSGGRRRGHWSRALLHPQQKSVRFKRRRRATIEGFKETFIEVFREDHGDIERETWIQGMLDDDVLQESLFVVTIPTPGELEIAAICDLAKRKLDRIEMERLFLPDRQLSTCDSPLSPCAFRCCCWSSPESRPDDGGFDEDV